MRTTAIMLTLLLAAGVTRAQLPPRQVGQLGVFADPVGADCNVNDTGGTLTVYVVHVNHEGAGKIDFMLELGSGFVGSWLSDESQFANTFGNSMTGVTVIYGGCQPAPTHVMTVHFAVQGFSSSCSSIDVVPNPNLAEPKIATTMCDEVFNRDVPPKNLVVNPDGLCDCTVPVLPVTWGRVKALYGVER